MTLTGKRPPEEARAVCVNPCEVFLGMGLNLVGERFDRVGAGHGIDGIGNAGFIGDDLLCAQGD